MTKQDIELLARIKQWIIQELKPYPRIWFDANSEQLRIYIEQKGHGWSDSITEEILSDNPEEAVKEYLKTEIEFRKKLMER